MQFITLRERALLERGFSSSLAAPASKGSLKTEQEWDEFVQRLQVRTAAHNMMHSRTLTTARVSRVVRFGMKRSIIIFVSTKLRARKRKNLPPLHCSSREWAHLRLNWATRSFCRNSAA